VASYTSQLSQVNQGIVLAVTLVSSHVGLRSDFETLQPH
jgi:hypothetical protein